MQAPYVCETCSGIGCSKCDHGLIYPDSFLKGQVDEIKSARNPNWKGRWRTQTLQDGKLLRRLERTTRFLRCDLCGHYKRASYFKAHQRKCLRKILGRFASVQPLR